MTTEPAVRAPSIRDVARVAGVSHRTVSRVLNDHVSIRAETRDRVLAAMAELRYRPDRAARALGSSRSGVIGVLASIRGEHGPARSIRAIEDEARRRGFAVASASVRSDDEAALRDALEHLIGQDVEGIVVLAVELNPVIVTKSNAVKACANDSALEAPAEKG